MTLKPVEDLEQALARLPGFGRRSAGRAALSLVREPARLLEPLIEALSAAKGQVVCCSRCGAFTVKGEDPCRTCTDPLRDGSVLCVVEEPSDIVQIESAGAFRGRYPCLGGKLAPAKRLGPERLRFREMASRVAEEGDATAGYAAELLKDSGVRVTRLAFGLPADSGIAYSDPLTLKRAIAGRRDV